MTYYDERRPELALRVTSAGAKSFYLIRRIHGRPEFIKLGSYPAMTIEQAQVAVTKLLAKVAEGLNPAQARRSLAAEPTFDEFFEEFWKRHAKFKKSKKDDEQRYRMHIRPIMGHRKLSAITEDDVKRVAQRMEQGGSEGATINRVRALLSVMFNKASEWEFFTKTNPTKVLKKKAEQPRERFLRGNEAESFFTALEDEPERWKHFFSLSLLLGQRRADTLAMRWADIDFVEKIWRIAETKNGKSHEVPLTTDALEILKLRWESRSESPFVFPGTGVKGHVADPKSAWVRVMKRASLVDLTIHDLRRTLGSWQAKSGVSLVTIGRTLGHKSLQTTLIYARLDSDPVRNAMQTANDALKGAAGYRFSARGKVGNTMGPDQLTEQEEKS